MTAMTSVAGFHWHIESDAAMVNFVLAQVKVSENPPQTKLLINELEIHEEDPRTSSYSTKGFRLNGSGHLQWKPAAGKNSYGVLVINDPSKFISFLPRELVRIIAEYYPKCYTLSTGKQYVRLPPKQPAQHLAVFSPDDDTITAEQARLVAAPLREEITRVQEKQPCVIMLAYNKIAVLAVVAFGCTSKERGTRNDYYLSASLTMVFAGSQWVPLAHVPMKLTERNRNDDLVLDGSDLRLSLPWFKKPTLNGVELQILETNHPVG